MDRLWKELADTRGLLGAASDDQDDDSKATYVFALALKAKAYYSCRPGHNHDVEVFTRRRAPLPSRFGWQS